MQRHGWTLLFHEGVIEQLRKLQAAAERAEHSDSQDFESNANVELFGALSQLITGVVPSDPARDEYRQENTRGPAYRATRTFSRCAAPFSGSILTAQELAARQDR